MKKEIKNVEVFNDTKKMIKDDEYLSAAVEQSKKKTTIHYGNDYPQIIIKENPDMEIVACQVADFDRAKAMSVMENILQANPEIDGLFRTESGSYEFCQCLSARRWRDDRCQCTGGMPLQMLYPLSGVRS